MRSFLKGAAFGAVAIYVLIWLFPSFAPVGASLDSAGHDDLPTLERLRARGVARVGFANEAPYAFVDHRTGELTGEAPEVARVVLRRLGVDRVEAVLTEFGALIPGLKASRFDLIAAGMYITPERCKQVAFSNPTYSIGEAFVVRQGNPLGLHSYADIVANDDATFGVVTGAIQQRYAASVGIPASRVAVFADAPSAVEAVAAGRIDAYGATSLTANDLLAKAADSRLERAEPFDDPVIDGETMRGYGAFVFRTDDDALRVAFDRELESFLGTEEHLEIIRRFGFGPENLPGDVTAQALCARGD